jgi:predicted N-formylglutamate amidohydrolase
MSKSQAKSAPPPEAAFLGPEDPPVFEIVNPDGAAPVLLVCDHASRTVPHSLGRLGLDDALLMRHIGWDIGAAEVTRGLAARFDAPAVLAGYSRLVVDCNRRLEDPSAMPEVSDGVAVPGNRALSAEARHCRIEEIYRPYHEGIAAQLARFAAQGRTPAVLSIHSFTPVMNGFVRPWHIGILWDADPRIAVPLLANLRAHADLVVGDNEPYSAKQPVGHTVRAHAVPAGLPHVAVEIRQDLIDTASGARHWAELLAAALDPILAAPDLYKAEQF